MNPDLELSGAVKSQGVRERFASQYRRILLKTSKPSDIDLEPGLVGEQLGQP